MQVTKKLDDDNEKREIKGIIEVMNEYKLKESILLTEEQEEERIIESKKIRIIPIWKWLLEEKE